MCFHYAFFNMVDPVRLHLVNTTSKLLANSVPPQNACMPLQLPFPTIAPATGLPIKIPRAAQNVFIPSRPPIALMSSVTLTTVDGCRETKAPEKAP